MPREPRMNTPRPVDPRMPTDAVTPAWLQGRPGLGGTLGRLGAEAWDHLWPWRSGAARAEDTRGFGPRSTLRLAGYALAAAVTLVWGFAAAGQLHSGAVIGWWFGWSVLEVLIRLRDKCYVKDGPWWGSRYRVANPMDMLSYVGFKNLLLGAALFLVLKAAGRFVL